MVLDGDVEDDYKEASGDIDSYRVSSSALFVFKNE